jgi:hypothetical protein
VKGGGTIAGEKFMLPLAKAGAPVESWRPLGAASQLIEDVLVSKDASRAFFEDPKKLLEQYGLDASDKTLADETVILLTSISHPAVQESLARADYESAFSYLEAAGLFEKRDPSNLDRKLEKLLAENIDFIRSSIKATRNAPLTLEQKNMLLSLLGDNQAGATEDDLTAVAQMVYSDVGEPASIVAVAVAAIAVAVVVGVGLVTHIHIATKVSVVGTSPEIQATQGALFTGAYARFDPALMRNVERAARLGAVVNDSGLQLHALRTVIAEECRAMMTAIQRLGIVDVRPENLPLVVDAVTKYSYKVLGISK